MIPFNLEEIKFCIDNGVDVNGSIPENNLNLLKDLQYDIPTTTVSRDQPTTVQDVHVGLDN